MFDFLLLKKIKDHRIYKNIISVTHIYVPNTSIQYSQYVWNRNKKISFSLYCGETTGKMFYHLNKLFFFFLFLILLSHKCLPLKRFVHKCGNEWKRRENPPKNGFFRDNIKRYSDAERYEYEMGKVHELNWFFSLLFIVETSEYLNGEN